ncbi:MAG: TrkA C-terminal domain-containing protein [Lachnospiraceae bacterium]
MDEVKPTAVSIPKYQQIAIEIASKIVNEEYTIGQKIHGRSFIAAQYNVSPETARRAFCILSDLDIVSPERGSGMVIKSKSNALEFLNGFSNRITIETLKKSIMENIQHQQKEINSLSNDLAELILATEHFRSMNPLVPFSVRITPDCKYLNRSIQELQLWQHTGATLVAIKRGDVLMRSPGPYAVVLENDVIYFVSQEDSDHRIKDFLF